MIDHAGSQFLCFSLFLSASLLLCRRNTIKALNWYRSVQKKLDDPRYAGWFVRFKDYKGRESNSSYHVPACDWYSEPGKPAKCSVFYHE